MVNIKRSRDGDKDELKTVHLRVSVTVDWDTEPEEVWEMVTDLLTESDISAWVELLEGEE